MTDPLFRSAVVDLSDNTTSITTATALIRGVSIVTTISGQTVPIMNGSAGSTQFTIPASSVSGAWIECGDTRMENGIYIDPNDAATGTISVIWKPIPVSE